jgi:hypothetical protein
MEHVLRQRGDLDETEIARAVGKAYGNFFKARERISEI